ncbi:MAG: PaaI family thioesterase, partial [Nitrospinota bacterium]
MYSAQAKDRFTQVPFARFLGAELVEVEHERAVVALPFQEENANPGGTLNGGATASLILLAGTLAAWTGIDLQTNPFLSTVDLALQYLSAAINEDVVAEARVLRRGRDLFFLDVMVQTPAGKPISKGLMMYRAPHYGGQPMRRHEKPVLLPPPTPLLPPYPLPEKGKYL